MPSPDLHATGLRPAEFGAALLDPGQSVPDDLCDHLHRRAGKRFDVYRNNVVSSLLEAMRKVYPSLAAIMGEANFNTVARAFVVRPSVLLADEPTGSLDFATGETVMALMFEPNREAGTTLVMVTHDKAIAERCDRQLRIEAGRLVD